MGKMFLIPLFVLLLMGAFMAPGGLDCPEGMVRCADNVCAYNAVDCMGDISNEDMIMQARALMPEANRNKRQINARIGEYMPSFFGALMGDHHINVMLDNEMAAGIVISKGEFVSVSPEGFGNPTLIARATGDDARQMLARIQGGQDPIGVVMDARESGKIVLEPQRKMVKDMVRRAANPVMTFVTVVRDFAFGIFGGN